MSRRELTQGGQLLERTPQDDFLRVWLKKKLVRAVALLLSFFPCVPSVFLVSECFTFAFWVTILAKIITHVNIKLIPKQ